ncbi:hypothetical protein [Ancylomarina sp.]|uniref:hypothetical protein n=1 Tax=Ancylomarina sp. TaxID=1970196 RepID=UPI00356711DB
MLFNQNIIALCIAINDKTGDDITGKAAVENTHWVANARVMLLLLVDIQNIIARLIGFRPTKPCFTVSLTKANYILLSGKIMPDS